jgi:hypothetical protein
LRAIVWAGGFGMADVVAVIVLAPVRLDVDVEEPSFEMKELTEEVVEGGVAVKDGEAVHSPP